MTLVDQITQLVIIHDLAPKSSKQEICDWYKWVYLNDQVEVIQGEDAEILGFIDWVRLEQIPKTTAEAKEIFQNQGHMKDRPVLFACNGYAKEPKVLFKLRRRILEKNKDARYYIFHNKQKDTMILLDKKGVAK